MKILYVSSAPLEYNSSANLRNVSLLYGLIQNGCEVYTLTQEPQHDLKNYDKDFCNLDIKKRYYIKLGKVHSKMTLKKNKENSIKQFIYKFLIRFKKYDFKSSLIKEINHVKIDNHFDFLISSSDPKSSHLLAERLIKIYPNITKKWIQYWGDPFACDINNKSKLVPIFILKKEEERLLKKCDYAVYVSPLTLEKQQKMYHKLKKKMFFLPIPVMNHLKKHSIKIKKGNISFGYFGDYYSHNRNIRPLYNSIKENNNFRLFICGDTDLKLESSDNIVINERLELNELKKLENNVDVLLCVCNKNGTQIPGKIYHYTNTGKPIIVLLDGENNYKIDSYLRKYNRFIICNNNEKDIKHLLENLDFKDIDYSGFDVFNAEKIAKAFISMDSDTND